MNKLSYILQWLLILVMGVSSLVMAQLGYELWQAKKINAFITSQPQAEQVPEAVPEDIKAQFAYAYKLVELGKTEQALEVLTSLLDRDQSELTAAIYFNRANIHLREAQTLADDDSARLSLVGLAKQDYRDALLLDSSLWNVRFNLELGLMMVPEISDMDATIKKGRTSSSVNVKAVGFRVDLP